MMDVEQAMKVADEQLALIDAGELATPQAKQRAVAMATLAAEVRRLAGAVPAGHVRDEKGVDRKVLGDLPVTVDGCVIGNKAYLWNFMPGVKGRDDDKPMRVCYKPSPIMDPDAYTDGPTMMWSTRAAAEAARGEP